MTNQPENYRTLLNQCTVMQSRISNIINKYSAIDSDIFGHRKQLQRLLNRASEFENGSFIILVVGPAKSGKSTLVNLLSGTYVSPTNFLECTVRPSIISRRTAENDCGITVFSSTNDNSHVEKIDSIIDTLRGFGTADEIKGVQIEEFELNADNIRSKVQLGLNESIDSNNLLTSIRTPGGKLLQDRVFIIDMPGFDGAYQNIDNPVYSTIAKRADLIIFVQSSNAAFSKVSKDFLNVLAQNNHNAPVCLVHNIFDAAWWRDSRQKAETVAAQRDFAIAEIRKMGFTLDKENTFCINLGAVQDYRDGSHDENTTLRDASSQFEAMETTMFERIIDNRDTTRLNNVIGRVKQLDNDIREEIDNEINSLNARSEKYRSTQEELNNAGRSIMLDEPATPAADTETIRRQIVPETKSTAAGIAENISKSNQETIDILSAMTDRIASSLNANINIIYGLPSVADNLYLAYRNAISELERAVAHLPGSFRAQMTERQNITVAEQFNIGGSVALDTIVPKKNKLKFWDNKHSGTDILYYIGMVRQMLAPDDTENPGVVMRNEVPRISEAVKDAIKQTTAFYNNSIKEYYDAVSRAVLNCIARNPEELQNAIENLSNLSTDLLKI